jgi:hypothetical protein
VKWDENHHVSGAVRTLKCSRSYLPQHAAALASGTRVASHLPCDAYRCKRGHHPRLPSLILGVL